MSEEHVAKFSDIRVSSQLSTQSHRKFSLSYLSLNVGMPVLRKTLQIQVILLEIWLSLTLKMVIKNTRKVVTRSEKKSS